MEEAGSPNAQGAAPTRVARPWARDAAIATAVIALLGTLLSSLLSLFAANGAADAAHDAAETVQRLQEEEAHRQLRATAYEDFILGLGDLEGQIGKLGVTGLAQSAEAEVQAVQDFLGSIATTLQGTIRLRLVGANPVADAGEALADSYNDLFAAISINSLEAVDAARANQCRLWSTFVTEARQDIQLSGGSTAEMESFTPSDWDFYCKNATGIQKEAEDLFEAELARIEGDRIRFGLECVGGSSMSCDLLSVVALPGSQDLVIAVTCGGRAVPDALSCSDTRRQPIQLSELDRLVYTWCLEPDGGEYCRILVQ